MRSVEADWLALALVPELGQKAVRRLLDHFGGIEALLNSDAQAIGRAAGLPAEVAAAIARARGAGALQRERDLMAAHRVDLLCLDSADYPHLLRQIHVPPPVLYVRGQRPLPEGFALGIVGTRRASRYGEQTTRRLIEELAANVPDLVVVSGLARGVDTVAHRQALALGLKTVAVLAGGLSDIYPPENRELAEQIAGQGALVTEFHMQQPPLGRHFPIRNRIISGLSRGVLVTQAGHRSGALITAGFALNHGREIFAVPGNVDVAAAAGCNRLIQRGQAKLVTRGEDILETFEVSTPPRPKQLDWLEPAREEVRPPQSEAHARVLAALASGPMHPDDLAAALPMPVETLLGLLLELELAGEICQTSNNLYAVP